MIYQYRFKIYFFLVLFFIWIFYKISKSFNYSIQSIIKNISTYFFGHNDLALRVPFILLYALSSFMMFKITKNYFKYEKDRFINVLIFMTLPGVLSAALLVNTAIIVMLFTLFYIYYYQKYQKHLYFILPFLLFLDK